MSGVSVGEPTLPNRPRLSEGDQGDCVRQLQLALNTVNSDYHLTEDGRFGPDTRIAVLDFQGRNHLGADGVVDPSTAIELARQAHEKGSVATPQPGQTDATSASDTPGSNHGEDYLRRCGTITCSEYLSHRATVALDNALEKSDPTLSVDTAAGACALVTTVFPGTAVPCLARRRGLGKHECFAYYPSCGNHKWLRSLSFSERYK
ncbi:MAG: peptidoglycan-binding protein [Actinomycetota bacterium]|nr:peptidoglycan-binding protein [Actinomycetota bacterium]